MSVCDIDGWERDDSYDVRRAVRRVYIQKYFPRPNTLGNRAGEYIARVIDVSIERLRGLLTKLSLN